MPVTKDDVQRFCSFIDERMAASGADSLRQLVEEWEERQQANAAVRRGIGDVDEGRTEPFSSSQDRFCQERGLPLPIPLHDS